MCLNALTLLTVISRAHALVHFLFQSCRLNQEAHVRIKERVYVHVCNLCVRYYLAASLNLSISFWYSLSLPSSVLHQCSCKHQCRQLLKALPFDLASVSCVGGQIAAVSHTQYLTQSPELWTHPPLCSVAPLTMHVSPPFMASSVLSVKVNSTFTAQRSLPQSDNSSTTS